MEHLIALCCRAAALRQPYKKRIPRRRDIGYTCSGREEIPDLLASVRDLNQKSPSLSKRAMVLGDDLLSHL